MLKIWTIFVLLLQLSALIDGKSLEIASYARVARNGDASSHEVDTKQQHQDPAEIVHYNKAEILTLGESGAVVAANNTERVSTVPKPLPTPDASSVGTGRAGGSVYPFPAFPLVLSPQRAKSISTYAPQQQFHNHHAPAYPRVVYSQRPSQVAEDRFAPGEAYAGTLYKVQQNKLQQSKLKAGGTGPGSAPQSSNIDSVSVPNAPPSVSSYSQQPSGLNSPVSSYNPTRVIPSPATPVFRPANPPANPLSSLRIVPASSNIDAAAVSPPDAGPDDDAPPSDSAGPNQYIPPPPSDLFKFPPNNNFDPSKVNDNGPPSSATSYLPPASGDTDGGEYLGPYNPDSRPLPPPPQADLQKPVEAVKASIAANSLPEPPKPYVISPADDHPPHDSYPPPSDYPPAPHDHHHDHFTGQFGFDASPDVVYDYDPHHHDHFDYHEFVHHHEHHEEPPPPPPEPVTTQAPEAPAEPRVKTYSYYYLGRKLWYVPLFFTLWFCFYVSALIIKSIARHKVQVPNHWQNRRRRALVEEPHTDTLRKVNKLTYFVMNHLTNFEQKYNKED